MVKLLHYILHHQAVLLLKISFSSFFMALSSSSCSSFSTSCSRNCVYDVFPSFSGEDVRVTFLSHFLKELDRKLITAFKDNEIKRSLSFDPELQHAIKNSRIVVVVLSRNYASSSWCLNELVEIMNCKKKFGQMVISVFYGLEFGSFSCKKTNR